MYTAASLVAASKHNILLRNWRMNCDVLTGQFSPSQRNADTKSFIGNRHELEPRPKWYFLLQVNSIWLLTRIHFADVFLSLTLFSEKPVERSTQKNSINWHFSLSICWFVNPQQSTSLSADLWEVLMETSVNLNLSPISSGCTLRGDFRKIASWNFAVTRTTARSPNIHIPYVWLNACWARTIGQILDGS